MKIAQNFCVEVPQGHAKRNSVMELDAFRLEWRLPVSSAESEALNLNFLFVETPNLTGTPVPCVYARLLENGRRSWRPILFSFSEAPPLHVIYDPAPTWLAVLLSITRDHYAPMLRDQSKAEQAVRCFIEFEDVCPHLAPLDFQHQNFLICSLWPEWERRSLSWAERALSLKNHGTELNPVDGAKNIDALEKRCRRLGLIKGTL